MVGVPGRSKGCNTCKQRRIACGHERPQCSQCLKSKRVCSGYQRERIFVLQEEHQSSKDLIRKPAVKVTIRLPTDRKNRGVLQSSTGNEATTVALIPQPSNTISLQCAYRQQLFSEFLHCYIPVDYHAGQRRGPTEEKIWLTLIPEMATLTTTLESAIFAICAAKLGRLRNDPALIRESVRLHGKSLWELQKTLWDPELMYKDETLAACMALLMYEAIECPSETGQGWVSHMLGCGKLIQLRGAKAHTSGLGHQLFLSFRKAEISQAMGEHRPTYLADKAWREIPWEEFDKTPLDRLLDAMALLANIIAQAYEMEGLELANLIEPTLRSIDRGWKMDAELQLWYEELENSTLGPLYWPQFSTMDNPADDPELGKVFPVAFHFLNLQMAQRCLLYWTTLLILWSGLGALHGILESIPLNVEVPGETTDGAPSSTSGNMSGEESSSCKEQARTLQSIIRQLPPLGNRLDLVSVARKICSSVEYCMQDEMRELGLGMTSLPLKVVIDILKEKHGDCRELLWVKAVMENVNWKSFRLLRYFGPQL